MTYTTDTAAFSTIAAAKGSVPAAWGLISAEILERQNEADLPELLLRALSTIIDFEFCAVFIYSGAKRPVVMHHSFPSLARAGLQNYVAGTYVLNPIYRAYRSGLKAGAYRLREFACARAHTMQPCSSLKVTPMPAEEIGYLTEGWPAGYEELCLIVELPRAECAEITLSRPRTSGFVEDDVKRVECVMPFIGAALRRYRLTECLSHLSPALRHLSISAPVASSNGTATYVPELSPRERQVAQLLLEGLSRQTIGQQLGISATTVKTHCRHLYEKLGVRSQRDLFVRLVASMHHCAEPPL